MKEFNLLYDASVIANGLNKDSNRSGIYFTALNILKELAERNDIKLSLYSSSRNYNDLCEVLKSEMPQKSFDIITDKKNIAYIKLKEKRNGFKNQNKPVRKIIFQILCLLYSPLAHAHEKFLGYMTKYKLANVSSFLSPLFLIPDKIQKYPKKKFVILYDMIPYLFPDKHKDSNPDSLYFQLLESLNSSNYYIAISENTRQDFLKHCNQIDRNKIITSLLACSESFAPISKGDILRIKEKYRVPQEQKYIFSLCTLEPRKNLVRAVKTFIKFIQENKIDDLVFVLGGGHWDEFISLIEKEIENLGNYKNKIIRAGYIEDEDLPALYSGAEWFVYTSMYEGFGLPPLEAMSCGCPVITSNNSSLPEVVGDAGIMIDWDSDEQHIKAYEKYYYDKDLREQFAKKGLERAKLFSWDKCVNAIITEMTRVG